MNEIILKSNFRLCTISLQYDFQHWYVVKFYVPKKLLCLEIHYVYLIREKAMAPHSSTLASKIPWMEEPGRLQSMGSLRVGHDWATSLTLFTFMHWRRKWQPTPVFLPGESQGWGSLVGYSPWGCQRVGHDWVTNTHTSWLGVLIDTKLKYACIMRVLVL